MEVSIVFVLVSSFVVVVVTVIVAGFLAFVVLRTWICFPLCSHFAHLAHDDVSTFKLRTNPTEANSQIYEMRVRTFKTGTVEQFILWKRDLNKVLVGQNVTALMQKFAMARRLLDGNALAAFNEEATALQNVETEATFEFCLQALAKHLFPKYALVAQKQWFRQSVHKKPGLRTREWLARLTKINEMLVEFPPNFDATQKIPEDESKDIASSSLEFLKSGEPFGSNMTFNLCKKA